jgi:hypothetical protein
MQIQIPLPPKAPSVSRTTWNCAAEFLSIVRLLDMAAKSGFVPEVSAVAVRMLASIGTGVFSFYMFARNRISKTEKRF